MNSRSGPDLEAIDKLVASCRKLQPAEQEFIAGKQLQAVETAMPALATAAQEALRLAVTHNRWAAQAESVDLAWEAADEAATRGNLKPGWPLRLAARYATEALVVADLLSDEHYQAMVGPMAAAPSMSWLTNK